MALEECILSILIAIARHSSTCASAIRNCERLVQTIVNNFTMKDTVELQTPKIKSVTLLRVSIFVFSLKCAWAVLESGYFSIDYLNMFLIHLFHRHYNSIYVCNPFSLWVLICLFLSSFLPFIF